MVSIDMPAGNAPADAKGVNSEPDAPRVNKLYFAAWRWHFYAGI